MPHQFTLLNGVIAWQRHQYYSQKHPEPDLTRDYCLMQRTVLAA